MSLFRMHNVKAATTLLPLPQAVVRLRIPSDRSVPYLVQSRRDEENTFIPPSIQGIALPMDGSGMPALAPRPTSTLPMPEPKRCAVLRQPLSFAQLLDQPQREASF